MRKKGSDYVVNDTRKNNRMNKMKTVWLAPLVGAAVVAIACMAHADDLIVKKTLEKSSASWHEGKHNIWPYVNYLLYTFDELYDQFEERFSRLKAPRGEKTATVESVLNSMVRPFTIREIEFKCPGISRETIKSVLKNNPDCFECTGRGAGARWRRLKPIVASTSSEEDG